jgi:hypothetical protein
MAEILKFPRRPRTEEEAAIKSPKDELLEAVDRRIAFLRESAGAPENLAACLHLRDRLVSNFTR